MRQRYAQAPHWSAAPRYPFGGNPVAADARCYRRRVHRVIVAGGGFGGIATAVALRRMLGPREFEIVLVDRRADFMMGLRKTWAVLGIAPLADGLRRLDEIRGVDLVQGGIERID